MIQRRDAFDRKVKVKYGTRCPVCIVGMPGDMYQVFFDDGSAEFLPGYINVEEVK